MPFTKGHPFYEGGEKGWFKSGKPSPLKGIKLSKEHVEKLRNAKLKNPTRYWLGKKRDIETIEKIRVKNKGKCIGDRKERIILTCLKCKKEFRGLKSVIGKQKFCSHICAAQREEQSPTWVAENVGMIGLHARVHKKRGKADHCENRDEKILKFKCNHKSNNYHWANISHEYNIDTNDFMSLCVPCHSKYDRDYRKYKV